MCGRYNLVTDAEALIDFFEIEEMLFDPDELKPRYNIAPGQDVPIVRAGETGRALAPARWGLVPHWSKEPKTKYSTINARAETVAEKPAYRDPFRHRRCLIPATGFYEWRKSGASKTPYHIRPQKEPLFAFAGLWDHWGKGEQAFDSCSIIVTGANRDMKYVHQRMPVILNPAQYNVWLNAEHFNRAQLESLLAPYSGRLDLYPVSRRVNSPANDDPSLIDNSGSG